MAQQKKILVTLPASLLQEVDSFVSRYDLNRSEFVREAMQLYMKEKRKAQLHEEMKQGYLAMAGLNAKLAEEGLQADSEAFFCYEEKLSECE